MQTGIDRHLPALLDTLRKKGYEFGEVYFEDTQSFNIHLGERKIKDYVKAQQGGAGLRILHRGVEGYSYTEDLSEEALLRALEGAEQSVRHACKVKSGEGRIQKSRGAKSPVSDEVKWDNHDFSEEAIVELIKRADEKAWSYGPLIRQVECYYQRYYRRIRAANTLGTDINDAGGRARFIMRITGERGWVRQTAVRSVSGNPGDDFLKKVNAKELVEETVEAVMNLLNALPCPSGTMPVVLAPGEGAVLFHEVVGHALEAERVIKGSSWFKDRIGKSVASPIITIIDDGTMSDRGSPWRFDDEGTPTQKTVLIRDGVLENFMESLATAWESGRAPTGNGRRQSFRFPPLPRMTCTVIKNGKTDPEDIIADVKEGLYINIFGGGRSDVAGGNFVFSAPEAWLIKNGKIADPTRGAVLTGLGKNILNDIQALGNDFAYENRGSNCGKGGQWVPVSHGQPTVLIKNLTVGGAR